GAGKSGYVRLLKHASGARRPGELLRNVFTATTEPQTATITVTAKEETKTLPWSGSPIPELEGLQIYDAACGVVYITEESEVAFEPWLLRLFSQLTSACTTLSQRIQEKLEKLVSKKPTFPAEYASTAAATWYAGIQFNTSQKEIDENTEWTDENEKDLAAINKRLAEPKPEIKAAALRRQKALLVELVTELKKHLINLSDERCATYMQLKSDAKAKRKAADEDAKKVFEKAPLDGVGSETWRILWEAARRYSEEQCYTTKQFPNIGEDAHCVLCQRILDTESRERFMTFENFVKSELQRLATEAEEKVSKFADDFVAIPKTEVLTVKMEAAGLTESSITAAVMDFVAMITQRRETCLAADEVTAISLLPTKETLIELIQLARTREKRAQDCDKDAKGENRPALEQKRKELSARKWLNQQHKPIEEESIRLKAVSLLNEADRLTNTKALSTRKSILTDELITQAYKERFQEELKRLEASNLSVEIDKSRADVGRVYHCIILCNTAAEIRTADILSEGESRIVSLAAFLADAKGTGAKTPFVFDDPISSLDQVYESATAKRLVDMSKSRQVIVFTHRLSLVTALEKYAEKYEISHEIKCLSEYVIGEVVDLPIDLKNTKKAINKLLNERLDAAKKALATGDEKYETEAKAICRDVRALIERIVECDLLVGIVRRLSPEVQTKNKIHHLANITAEECKFIDKYMTKYSRYEHSQSEEAPVPLPKPEDFEDDLKEIAGFIAAIKDRTKS
ncbi:MAG: AAA family ATPase, partial [Planctomycetota bacterium]